MFFTKEDYEKIELYLKQNSKRDTDFEYLDSDLIGPNDVIAVVHDTKNRKVNLQDIFLSKVYEDLYEQQRAEWAEKAAELQDMIDNLKINEVHITDTFGDSDIVGVSQKTLTSAFNKIWEKLEDITGETYQGIYMVVTPTYFIGENGCNVHITANTVATNGIFEKIAFYGNGQLIVEAENKSYFEYDTYIEETTVIECIAQIMGREYKRQETIVHYNSFWLGGGYTYEDVMTVLHVVPITNGMRGAYNIEVKDDQHIIIIVGENLQDGFIRADLNSVEIPFTEETITVNGENYKVFTSVNTYNPGIYNIDING